MNSKLTATMLTVTAHSHAASTSCLGDFGDEADRASYATSCAVRSCLLLVGYDMPSASPA